MRSEGKHLFVKTSSLISGQCCVLSCLHSFAFALCVECNLVTKIKCVPRMTILDVTKLGLKRIVHWSYRIIQVQTNEYNSNTFEYQTGKMWFIQCSKSQ